MFEMNMNNAEQLVTSFDLDWSDRFEDSVRANTFQRRAGDLLKARKCIEGDSELNFALFNSLPQGHPSTRLWLESETDLKASIYLALGGYYRQALACLRTWQELTVVGIYYRDDYRGENSSFRKWMRGEAKTPYWRGRAPAASRSPNIMEKLFGKNWESSSLANSATAIHDKLSKFVHLKELDRLDLQRGRENVPRYLVEAFDYWIAELLETYACNVRVLLEFYPQEIGKYLKRSPQATTRLNDSLDAALQMLVRKITS